MSNAAFLAAVHPWAALEPDARETLAAEFDTVTLPAGHVVLAIGDTIPGLHIIKEGQVSVVDSEGTPLTLLGPRHAFGERGLLSEGVADVAAHANEPTIALFLPADRFHAAMAAFPALKRHYARERRVRQHKTALAETRVADLMTANPITISPDTPANDAARLLRDKGISSLLVVKDDHLSGVVTIRDISGRVVADGLDPSVPVSEIMTRDLISLPPDAIGSDVLHLMIEQRIGHIPIVGTVSGLVGIVTQTDLTRFQADTSADLVGSVAGAQTIEALQGVTARIPQMLAQLVGTGHRHEVVTRLITDIADAVTRRLLAMAEADLGPPPVPYLWLACGSQGRREQTGTSDQDNCLFLDDSIGPDDDAYFEKLARFVCGGLNACGYVHCPGDMMATNARWRVPVRVWRSYFDGWIRTPDPMAQMLASVMFDLRPIGGETSLHANLQAETLQAASQNSIFVAHMVSNSLKHAPPLGLLGGLTTLRSGEHRNTLDLKMNGVVPIVDLGRIYALRGRLSPVNTRARIEAARDTNTISQKGGRDLLDAYDLIAQTRLEHQAAQVREGEEPNNFMAPAMLSEFERHHLRDAFVIVRQMQSAATQGRGVL